MQIQIGELYLGGNSKYQISPGIQGLDSPAIRVGDGLYAGRDGGFVSGHFYGHRTLTIKGFYIGDDCEEASGLRRVLASYLRIKYALPIVFSTASGEYFTEGFVTSVKSNVDNLVSGEFQITLLCPDPIIYESEDKEPVIYEVNLSNGSTVNVPNDGDVPIAPIITITGELDGIEIVNRTTEETMQVDIATENPTDVVVIDMKDRLITLNGTSVSEYRTPLSSWWVLVQENNEIDLDVGSIESGVPATVTAKISYKKGFAGI